ncbi:50S ribosomal protein L9, partial [Fulvivirga sp.]
MEVILKQDIQGLGYKNDTVSVKPGYGRNYLITQGFAIIANEANRKMINENIKQAAHKAEKLKKDAEEIAKAL